MITLNDYTRAQDFAEAALVLDHLGEPGLPFEVIQGEAQTEYFDLALASELLQAAWGS